MTIFLETPRNPSDGTFAFGVATLADIAGASRDSLLYANNSYSASEALQRVLDERRATIHSATGTQLQDPLAAAHEEFRRQAAERSIAPFSDRWNHDERPATLDEIYDRHLTAFRDQLVELSEKFPDSREAIGADRDPWDEATQLARESEERLARLMASRSGLGKYGAMLAGGMAGALADPITLVSLAAGGGPGAGRTVAQRILSVSGREALINSAAEAAIQPGVQAWRERAGLDAGIDEAIRNVLFGAAVGGAFGGALGAAGEGLRHLVRPRDTTRAAEMLAAEPRLSEPARAMLAGDGLRAAETLSEIRPALPAAARGALDRAEAIRLADQARPEATAPQRHDALLGEADRAVRLPDALEAWPGFQPDEAAVQRIVRAIAGPAARPAEARTESLTDFLIGIGGLRDHQGELRQIGAGEIVRPFRGRLVRPDGVPLDRAREMAAEAGYLDGRYGDANSAAERSTINDLLDLITEDTRGNTVLPGGATRADTTAEAAQLAHLEGTVAEIARHAGPGADPALIERAARISIDEGLDPFDALERVFVQEPPPAARPERTGDPLPGWSDAELLAASERRGSWPEPDGLDQPGRLTPDDADIAELRGIDDDMMVPTEDGLISVAELRGRIEASENLARVVEACRA